MLKIKPKITHVVFKRFDADMIKNYIQSIRNPEKEELILNEYQ